MADRSLQSRIADLIARLNRQLEKDIEDRIRDTRLPVEQVRILDVLGRADRQDGVIMSELARLAVVDVSTLTKLIDRMISDSLVHRAPDLSDRRCVRVFASARGEALYRRLKPVLEQQDATLRQAIDAEFTAGSSADLSRLLDRLCQGDTTTAAGSG